MQEKREKVKVLLLKYHLTYTWLINELEKQGVSVYKEDMSAYLSGNDAVEKYALTTSRSSCYQHMGHLLDVNADRFIIDVSTEHCEQSGLLLSFCDLFGTQDGSEMLCPSWNRESESEVCYIGEGRGHTTMQDCCKSRGCFLDFVDVGGVIQIKMVGCDLC